MDGKSRNNGSNRYKSRGEAVAEAAAVRKLREPPPATAAGFKRNQQTTNSYCQVPRRPAYNVQEKRLRLTGPVVPSDGAVGSQHPRVQDHAVLLLQPSSNSLQHSKQQQCDLALHQQQQSEQQRLKHPMLNAEQQTQGNTSAAAAPTEHSLDYQQQQQQQQQPILQSLDNSQQQPQAEHDNAAGPLQPPRAADISQQQQHSLIALSAPQADALQRFVSTASLKVGPLTGRCVSLDEADGCLQGISVLQLGLQIGSGAAGAVYQATAVGCSSNSKEPPLLVAVKVLECNSAVQTTDEQRSSHSNPGGSRDGSTNGAEHRTHSGSGSGSKTANQDQETGWGGQDCELVKCPAAEAEVTALKALRGVPHVVQYMASGVLVEQPEQQLHQQQSPPTAAAHNIRNGVAAASAAAPQQCLVMELFPGSLSDWGKQGNRWLEVHAKAVAVQLLQAVKCMHSGSTGCVIVHRDLKSSNVLLRWESGKPVIGITDFGISFVGKLKPSAQQQDLQGLRSMLIMSTLLCTPGYAAPEIFRANLKVAKAEVAGKGEQVEVAYTAAVDVFHIGLMMLDLLMGGVLHVRGLRVAGCEGYGVWDEVMAKVVARSPG